MSYLAACLALLVVATSSPAQKKKQVWYDDFDRAVKVAKRTRKDLLVDFTGSDWCQWCVKLHNEVLSRKEFVKRAKRRFVLVVLDYPMGEELKSRVPRPKRNEELAEEYSITGYPTILLIRRDGTVIGRTSYRKGGAKAYAEHIEEIHKSGKKTLDRIGVLERRLKRAKPDDREVVVREAWELFKPIRRGFPGWEPLARILEKSFEIDPDNQEGLLHEIIGTMVDKKTASPNILELVRKYDPKNAKKMLQRIGLAVVEHCSGPGDALELRDEIERLEKAGANLESDVTHRLYVNASIWLDQYEQDAPKAKKYARVGLGLRPGVGAKATLEAILAK